MTSTLAQPRISFRPVIDAGVVAPLSVPASDYRRAVEGGATPIDIRSQSTRDRDGALLGAIAIPADDALDRLTPGSSQSLRLAAPDARWVLVSDDGHDAEWLAWHLQARGISGARFVVGGHRRLRAHGINGPISSAELSMIAAHDD